MPGRLENKTCIVTGAAQGIGRATAEAFNNEGAKVIAIDIDSEKLKELDNIPGITTRVMDVRDGVAARKLADEIGYVDVLFNCVGYVHEGMFLDTPEDKWDLSFDVNVKSMYHYIQAFLPEMLKHKKGSIINMSSLISTIKGIPSRSVYGATKAAVIGLTKGVAAEHLQQQVRCNVICPGSIYTEQLAARLQVEGNADEAVMKHIEEKGFGRLGKTEEVASLCVYLGSDESMYHTGAVFVIDGGLSL